MVYLLGKQRCEACGFEQMCCWPITIFNNMECTSCGDMKCYMDGAAVVLPPDNELAIKMAVLDAEETIRAEQKRRTMS